MKHFLSKLKHDPKWLHKGHSYAHLVYFGAVFVEGHGLYGSMGEILLIFGVLSIFATGSEE